MKATMTTTISTATRAAGAAGKTRAPGARRGTGTAREERDRATPERVGSGERRIRSAQPVGRLVTDRRPARRGPHQVRPAGAPMRYPVGGVLMSRASHRRRPITPATTVVLALLAAGVTVWLGLVAELGGVSGPAAPVPAKLAVVHVQSGESLQHVARRVAPGAPVGDVVSRIRELNALDAAGPQAGQTLIAPVG